MRERVDEYFLPREANYSIDRVQAEQLFLAVSHTGRDFPLCPS